MLLLIARFSFLLEGILSLILLTLNEFISFLGVLFYNFKNTNHSFFFVGAYLKREGGGTCLKKTYEKKLFFCFELYSFMMYVFTYLYKKNQLVMDDNFI